VTTRQRELPTTAMSDRGFLFLFSILMILGGLGTAAWLFISGQADTVDGLFMLLTALLVAAVFGLYVKFMIGRAKAEVAKSAAQPAKAGAPAAASKPTPATVSQS
jgi:hypothetical protein